MNETKLNWDDLRLFVAVARAGGLASAEKTTGKSAPTLGRRMLALEAYLRQDLFHRRARGYELTADGQVLFERLAQVESTITPLDDVTDGERLPRVKLSAGTWITYYLCNQTGDWSRRNNIPLQFISADHILDIAHREAVIGIRNKRPSQNSLACMPLDVINFACYAKSEDIKTWAQVLNETPSAAWISDQIGDALSIQVTLPRNALDLALAGTCRAVLPTFIGDSFDSLVRVSDEIEDLSHQQWLVTHQDDRHKHEVREVINWLKSELGGASALAAAADVGLPHNKGRG